MVTARLFRIKRSCVARDMRCARAVATISRSAGSPWKARGSLSSAVTTSTSRGSTSITPAASRIHASNERSKMSRSFACSICASHKLTAARRSAAREASRSSAFRSCTGSWSEPSSHQIQTCVSSRISGSPRNPSRRAQTPQLQQAAGRTHEGSPRVFVAFSCAAAARDERQHSLVALCPRGRLRARRGVSTPGTAHENSSPKCP